MFQLLLLYCLLSIHNQLHQRNYFFRILDVDWETKLIDKNDQENTNTFEIVFRIWLKVVPDFSGYYLFFF